MPVTAVILDGDITYLRCVTDVVFRGTSAETQAEGRGHIWAKKADGVGRKQWTAFCAKCGRVPAYSRTQQRPLGKKTSEQQKRKAKMDAKGVTDASRVASCEFQMRRLRPRHSLTASPRLGSGVASLRRETQCAQRWATAGESVNAGKKKKKEKKRTPALPLQRDATLPPAIFFLFTLREARRRAGQRGFIYFALIWHPLGRR